MPEACLLLTPVGYDHRLFFAVTMPSSKVHQDVLCQLVDLIGITSIMEVLIRLVGADDHFYPNSLDVMQWLAYSNFLEMIVDKLSPSCPPEVHANAAETLCAITRNASSALAAKLSSPSFVARIFDHALDDSTSKSGLVHSLSVCISLLDPKRSIPSLLIHSIRSQHMYESPTLANPETVGAMLPKLGHLLMLLNVSSDEKVMPTTYGELRPPLGKYRLKIVEFIAVLLKTGNEVAEKELVSSGTIQRILDLFFEYPFNNSLHHHVESIIISCLESKNNSIVDHLLQECDLIGKILQTNKYPILSTDLNQPTLPAAGKQEPRAGNIGHITRISNKLAQLGNNDIRIQTFLQEKSEWNDWQTTVLQERNMVENVYRWACGRPTALQDRTRDSDEDDLHDRDYDFFLEYPSASVSPTSLDAIKFSLLFVAAGNGAIDRDEDVYFDDESAEVVISSLRLGGDQGSLFTNSNWFAFQDDRITDAPVSTSLAEMMDEINLNGTSNNGHSSSDDEVVVDGDEELAESKTSANGTLSSSTNISNGFAGNNLTSCGDRALDNEPSQVGGSSVNPFEDSADSSIDLADPDSSNGEIISNGTSVPSDSSDGPVGLDLSQKGPAVPSLFEDDVEFVGVELEGTEKAMEHALKEGIVGEAGPLKRNIIPKMPEENGDESGSGIKEFNDTNYWRVDQEVAVLE
ncbi:SIT4 phosphatase-associated family protein [Actinidia rufa]|uniref:SIT4 phosphatase-associated family protein n=1 Tax=Actinidia rufa TaxID=165716 RepID=A0A7J0GQS7_9ERIC|nr:SIT4 phosphatase-associated family protein [Actinidia rufa]